MCKPFDTKWDEVLSSLSEGTPDKFLKSMHRVQFDRVEELKNIMQVLKQSVQKHLGSRK